MANSLPDFTRISQPFAVSGNRSSIPQTTTGTNAASFQDGFPPITSIPLPDGGMPPKREDFNALGYISTSTLAFLQQGGLFTFDTAISNLIGGYPQGAVLNYIVNNKVYRLISLVNNNTYNFNSDSSYIGQYWDYVNDNQSTGGGMQMGTIFPFVASQPPVGAYLLNGQTIYNCATLYPDFWSWLNGEISANRVRSVSASVYQQEIIQYGICNAFVVSGNDVRLPLWKGYQTPLGNSVPVVGDGKSLGLTDGEENNGITVISSGITPRPDAYGVNVGTATTTAATTFTAKLSLGVTTDADNSGLIADTSRYKQDGFYWCIQVFNAATGLSTQESAQLASQMQMKAQTDLANVTNKLSDNFLEKIMPDYTAGIDIDFPLSATPYTAPCNGIYVVNFYVYKTTTYLYINNIRSAYSQHNSQGDRDSSSITINLKKGDTIYWDLNYSQLNSSTFYPLKGAN